jgi:hypothetical protein
MDLIVIALAPFYACSVAVSCAVTMICVKAGVALFGNAQELQDKKSE